MYRGLAAFGAVAFAIASFAGCEPDEDAIGCAGADGDGYCPEAPECDLPTDCIGVPSCYVRTCENHQCGGRPAPRGTVIRDYARGDCARAACTGDGHVFNEPDPADVPNVGECLIGTCDPGDVPTKAPDGLSCSVGVCKDGQCVPQ